jgi:hypothetical protein
MKDPAPRGTVFPAPSATAGANRLTEVPSFVPLPPCPPAPLPRLPLPLSLQNPMNAASPRDGHLETDGERPRSQAQTQTKAAGEAAAAPAVQWWDQVTSHTHHVQRWDQVTSRTHGTR